MASQSVPGFNADEVKRMWDEDYKRTLAELGEDVMLIDLDKDLKTVGKEPERKRKLQSSTDHIY
jgi:hypothetical protein